MLEEIEMPYEVHSINIAKDEQFQPHFLISPNNRIPAIVDRDNNNYSLFESGAILLYLAEKSGKLINTDNRDDYYRTLEWLMWQMGGVGPMFGQVHHFVKYNKGKSEYSETRYSKKLDVYMVLWTKNYQRVNILLVMITQLLIYQFGLGQLGLIGKKLILMNFLM